LFSFLQTLWSVGVLFILENILENIFENICKEEGGNKKK